ncbi:RCC1/BLIP-II protein [Venturia nashicola]|uniref:RCC1/BLIP-II protein n=1 Tax=Venturia nashicola TaxID=86259 RepID=A0A4Z1NWK9_9PEZI|nr:RCC1/BLIP-II protein [Venturia nashicola]TLD29689.1 RCC1/BLIP-II protein [Venturia nashicola]
MPRTTFSDLPLDIVALVVPYLDASSFLSLCATCKSLNEPNFRSDSSYWTHATRSKFRLPNRLGPQVDGLHWQRLYKRLLTQSRVYTWGQNTHGCLGHGIDEVDAPRQIYTRGMGPRVVSRHRVVTDQAWPGEMTQARHLGVIADLQCGGWSTTVLNDKGVLFTVGVIDGQLDGGEHSDMTRMTFPSTTRNTGAHVAIRQFSSGRAHILGLSDDNSIWSWSQTGEPGREVSLSNLSAGPSNARSVVAGWNKSSAFLPGTGIVLWDVSYDTGDPEQPMQIDEWVVVPKSGYQRPVGKKREPDEATRLIGEEVGEVVNHIVLEHFVVFVTDVRKVFAARIHWTSESGVIHDSFELKELQSKSREDSTPSVTDVNGSFRTFAVFKENGEVQITDQEYLAACAKDDFDYDNSPRPALKSIPALQKTGVVQLAFGDYHYHALHADGSISSYGREPGGSGALGLGSGVDMGLPPGMLRGIKYDAWNRDGDLLPHAYYRGRRIWFHPDQEKWIRFLAAGGKDHDESKQRTRQVTANSIAQGEVSEWIEQMGSDWDKRPAVKEKDEDGLGAYFALSVAAAGWHSGTLVVVNDELVQAVSDSCLVQNEESEAPAKGKSYIWHDDDFPRLEGQPGTIPVSQWKEEKPEWTFE